MTEHVFASALVATTLAAWALGAGLLAARAERELDASAPRPPWAAVAATIVLAVLARPPADALVLGVSCVALVALAPGDARTGLLFDAVTRPCAIAVVLLSVALGRTELATIGAVGIAGAFAAIVVSTRGRWMGLGDVKAVFALGAAFGAIEAVLAILVACLSGIAYARLGEPRRRELPFGPHLAVGACTVLVVGPYVVRNWMRL